MTWWKRFLSEKPPVLDSTPVQMGIVKASIGLMFCDTEEERSGVKLVTVSVDFLRRYNDIVTEYQGLQDEMKALPTSLRPRRKRVKEVSG